MSEKQKIDVIIPVFNEEANIGALCDRLGAVMSERPEYDWRLIFVDDGSRDGTVDRLVERQAGQGLPITILRFSRNFGHQAALKAGLDYADADAVIMMDGDGQHPPEMIGKLIELWRAGNKVVQTVRGRQQATVSGIRPRLVRWAYALINTFADRPIPPECADFRLMDRCVVATLQKMPEVNPTLRALVAWVGFEQATVEYEVQNRISGQSRFTFRQLLNLLAGGIFDLSRRPLTLAPLAGALLIPITLILWLAGAIGGWGFYAAILAAVQLFALGLLGAYLGRAYYQVLGRPLYIISEKINLPE